jgi:secreted PhoX family phosphatase
MEEKTLSRRAVLRGALAVTCSMVMPITFFSSSAAGADAAAKSPKAAKKVSKTSVKYQYKPNGENRCGTCINFIAASKTCKRVAGPIDPNGWCMLWGKKT